jgi:AcrR family transcriptional regulator
MNEDVKTRRAYHAPRRAEQTAATRRAVLAAARELFTTRGYTATTVAQIAGRAGVNVDTLYATVGRKPVLLREVLETAISGQDHAVPAMERDYVRAAQAAPTAAAKIEVYAAAQATILPRTAPIFVAIRDAGVKDPQCAKLYTEITGRRAANMRLFVAELRATGAMREDLTDDDAADIVWSMNAAEYYVLLVNERGWTPAKFGTHLADTWSRVLLASPYPAPGTGTR